MDRSLGGRPYWWQVGSWGGIVGDWWESAPLQDWKHGQKAVMQQEGAMPSWDIDVMTLRCVWDLEVKMFVGTLFQGQVFGTVLFKRSLFSPQCIGVMMWGWVRPPREEG